jgi:hypothetical protein
MVHTKLLTLVLLNTRQLKQRKFTSVGASKLRIHRFVTVAINNLGLFAFVVRIFSRTNMAASRNTVTLLGSGLLLAIAVTWVTGVFAAISFAPQELTTIKPTQPLAILLFGVALQALPAFCLSLLSGAVLVHITQASRVRIVAIVSAPWVAITTLSLLLPPFADEAPDLERLRPLMSWQLWPLLLAVPLGLWLATMLLKTDRSR